MAAGLDASSAAYLEQIRQAAGKLAHRELDPADARGALEELGELVAIDVDVPTLSRRPAVRYLKGGVKQLGGWYLRYVAQQVTAFGTATVAFGAAMSAARRCPRGGHGVPAPPARHPGGSGRRHRGGEGAEAMRVGRIDQLVPGFAKYDAIGNHAIRVRDALRGAGIASDIYAEHIDPRVTSEARHFDHAPPPDPSVALLYHLSTHSEMVPRLLERAAAGQPLLSDYHNITPASYFTRWEPLAAHSMALARRELLTLAAHVPFSVADSEFNAAELLDAGYARAQASPILLDLDAYHEAPSPGTLDRLRRRRDVGGPEWLFVGRIAPNKCQHDVVAAFAAYRRCFAPAARLSLVGSATSTRYLRALRQLCDDLGVSDAVEVVDNVGHRDLLAHFAVADVFVCLSEHEGFCVPVVEAMELGVPVVAFDAAALPETLAGAGVVVADKDPLAVAVAVDAVVSAPTTAAALRAAGRQRAATYALPVTSAQMVGALTGWLGAA